ncbi:hypothetical protein [Sphingomonas sanxanigenens]|uniref:hypothetical protein n=1 Tax=Sphingomonas sanxanigenens TaxID=397260 RepID=UPI001300E220|nr:hypothetical protein [Sphingomonas sanxanigenens]
MSERSLGETFELASRGDGSAQYEMAQHTIRLLNAGAVPWGVGVAEALLWARQAEINGADPVVRTTITGLLLIYTSLAQQEGIPEMAAAEFAEAIARLDALADAGDEMAGSALAAVLDEASPVILAWAKTIRNAGKRDGSL